MKIAVYFSSMAAAGGIERVIAKHIEFLADRHQIVLITKDAKDSFFKLPVSVKRESLEIDFNLDMTSQVKRILRIASTFLITRHRLNEQLLKHMPDVIYVASPLSLLELFFAQLSCRNVVVTEHSSYPAYNLIYKLIIRIFYKKVGLLTVPTSDDSLFYSSHGITNAYLPNPLTFFPTNPSSLQNKIVLNVGRLTDDKRHDLLIKIWSLTKGKNDGWHLKIIGQGENFNIIKELIYRLKLEDSVFLLPNTQEIEREFISASIFALTSRSEGFGLVLAEAMASGVPCVAFNCPSGPKDIVTNNISGYLIAEDDISSFVKHLDDLMESEMLRNTLGTQARIDVLRFEEGRIRGKFNVLINDHFANKSRA